MNSLKKTFFSSDYQVRGACQDPDEDGGGDKDQELVQIRERLEEKKRSRALGRGSCHKVQKDKTDENDQN